MIIEVKNFFRNDYGLSIFNKVYSILVGIASSAFYVRYLGLEYKGIYSYINEITTIIGLVINLGIYQSYPFFYRKKGNNIFKSYADIFVIQFGLYVSMSATISILFHNNMIIRLICLQLPFFVLKTQLENIVIVEKIKLYMWADMALKTLLALIYMILWLTAPIHVSYVVLTVASTNFLISIVYLKGLHYRFSYHNLKPDLNFFKEVVIFGVYPMLSALLMTLNYSVDIIFLEHLSTPNELSLYSVAAVLINYVWLIPNAFKEVLISKIAKSDSNDQISFSCRISLLITLICLIGFAIVGRKVVGIVFGVDFIECYLVTLVLFIGAFSMIFFKMLGVAFVAEGRQKEYFIILMISVIVNLVLNFLLIPIWRMYGAAFASVMSYSVCGIAFLCRYCAWKKVNPLGYIFIKNSDIAAFRTIIKRRKI